MFKRILYWIRSWFKPFTITIDIDDFEPLFEFYDYEKIREFVCKMVKTRKTPWYRNVVVNITGYSEPQINCDKINFTVGVVEEQDERRP